MSVPEPRFQSRSKPRRQAPSGGQFTRRRFVPEHMDDPEIDPETLGEALRFIRLVNARLGGIGAALGHVRRWTAGWPADWPIRILDLGTGAADIPLALLRWGRTNHLRLEIVAVDNHRRTLDYARRCLSEAGEHGSVRGPEGGIELVEADVRRLMDRFAPGEFDIVHAGMFLHHLPDLEILTVLRIMERLGRVGLIWNDLARDLVSAAAIRILTVGLPPMVRHDAVVSVAKGFKRHEALAMARRAGLRGLSYRRHLFGRFTLTGLGAGT